jgi:hypothetical protein
MLFCWVLRLGVWWIVIDNTMELTKMEKITRIALVQETLQIIENTPKTTRFFTNSMPLIYF